LALTVTAKSAVVTPDVFVRRTDSVPAGCRIAVRRAALLGFPFFAKAVATFD
jgi:hypothetical protein